MLLCQHLRPSSRYENMFSASNDYKAVHNKKKSTTCSESLLYVPVSGLFTTLLTLSSMLYITGLLTPVRFSLCLRLNASETARVILRG